MPVDFGNEVAVSGGLAQPDKLDRRIDTSGLRNMLLRYALSHRRLSFSLICLALILLSASSLIRTSDGAARWRPSQLQSNNAALPAAEYEVIVLPAPAQLSDTSGLGIARGQAVGTGRIAGAPDPDQTHAVLWSQDSGVGVDLHPPDFRYSAALETDGLRQVGYGNGPATAFQRHALLWSGSAFSYVDLHPGGIWTDSIARAIAGAQQVGNINYYFQGNESSPQSAEHAAVWRGSAASVVDLHPNGIGCERSYGNDTDGNRQVGYGYFPASSNTSPYRALLWSGTAQSAVVLHPPGFSHSFAEGISGNEQVGYAYNVFGDGYSRALLWHGTAQSVISLHPARYLSSAALATNGTMQVGYGGGQATNYQSHALRWSGAAESVVDLHSLLPAEFSQGGSIAYDIDALGNIVGLAQRPDGTTAAVLWRRISRVPLPTPTPVVTPTPTPKPVTVTLHKY